MHPHQSINRNSAADARALRIGENAGSVDSDVANCGFQFGEFLPDLFLTAVRKISTCRGKSLRMS
jgi:hypothetical protein